jgi:hypothetical protein
MAMLFILVRLLSLRFSIMPSFEVPTLSKISKILLLNLIIKCFLIFYHRTSSIELLLVEIVRNIVLLFVVLDCHFIITLFRFPNLDLLFIFLLLVYINFILFL